MMTIIGVAYQSVAGASYKAGMGGFFTGECAYAWVYLLGIEIGSLFFRGPPYRPFTCLVSQVWELQLPLDSWHRVSHW